MKKYLTIQDLERSDGLIDMDIQQIKDFEENHLNKYKDNEHIRNAAQRIPDSFKLENIWKENYFELKERIYSIFYSLLPDFGSTIKLLRKTIGWTQNDLAKRLNVTQAYISNLEKTKDVTNEEIKKEILNLFDCSMNDWLLYEYLVIGYHFKICTLQYFTEESETVCFSGMDELIYTMNLNVSFKELNERIIERIDEEVNLEEEKYNEYYYKKILHKANELNSQGKEKLLNQLELLLNIPDFKN